MCHNRLIVKYIMDVKWFNLLLLFCYIVIIGSTCRSIKCTHMKETKCTGKEFEFKGPVRWTYLWGVGRKGVIT